MNTRAYEDDVLRRMTPAEKLAIMRPLIRKVRWVTEAVPVAGRAGIGLRALDVVHRAFRAVAGARPAAL